MGERRDAAAPGKLTSPGLDSVRREYGRAREFFRELGVPEQLQLILSGRGQGPPGADESLKAFVPEADWTRPASSGTLTDRRTGFDAGLRLKRQFEQLLGATRGVVDRSDLERERFWSGADRSSSARWQETTRDLRAYFWNEVIGRIREPVLAPNPRSRLTYDQSNWLGYEVALDLWDGVFAYGILLIPKDLKPGERRPVVVAQHGLEGRPQQVVDPKIESVYHAFGAQLADEGFVVYAPQNPYIGKDRFRTLQRLANPLRTSIYSVIVEQHQQTLNWLKQLPFVDPKRIGFYGLSYGGVTAMKVPALLEDYSLSICSANFNEWVWKTTRLGFRSSYMFTREYEMFDFNLGNTFNHAELAALIAPRPFMVERGHQDGVAPDHWVAYEYAKVRRLYVALGIPGSTRIEFFDGGHEIHGQGTFQFLRRHLDWTR